jgi:hypothetical protein
MRSLKSGVLILLLSSFALCAAQAASSSQSSPAVDGATHVRLICFSILSPKAAKSLPDAQQADAERGWMAQASCDAMCVARSAACVTTEGFGGANACDAIVAPIAEISACRCCATQN